MELIFFIIAWIVLWFNLVTRAVLVTQQHLGYCWTALAQFKTFSVSDFAPKWVCWGWARCWEGTQLAQLTRIDHRDLSCRLMVCSTIKLGGIFSEVAVAWGLAVISLMVVSDCLCLIWGVFSFSPLHWLNWLYLDACVFLLLPLWFSSPSRELGKSESKQLCGA